MTTVMIWIIISTIGLSFSVYETVKSYQATQALRNKFNGRRIMARYLLFKAATTALIFLDFAILGGITLSMMQLGVSLATEEMVRQTVTRPGVILGIVLWVITILMQTITRVRLEIEYKRTHREDFVEQPHPDVEHGLAPAEVKNE